MNIQVDNQDNVTTGVMRFTSDKTQGRVRRLNNNYFSCGVPLLVNLEEFYLKNNSDDKLIKKFLKEILNRNTMGAAIALVSVTKQPFLEGLNDVLEKLSTSSTDWVKNPNSVNEIKVYTFVLE